MTSWVRPPSHSSIEIGVASQRRKSVSLRRRLLEWRADDPVLQQDVRRLGHALQLLDYALHSREVPADHAQDVIETLLDQLEQAEGRLPALALMTARAALHHQVHVAAVELDAAAGRQSSLGDAARLRAASLAAARPYAARC